MKFKIFIFLILLIFLEGCSPVYKVVYDYIPPKDKNVQKKLAKCYKDKKSCVKKCSQDFLKCQKNAQIEAQKEYQQKLKEYNQKLSLYNYNLRKKEELEERVSYYKDICNSKHDRYACAKALNYESDLKELKYLYKPIQPDKFQIYQNLINTSCQKECRCEDLFRSCYISAGGEVTSHKVCIRNCD